MLVIRFLLTIFIYFFPFSVSASNVHDFVYDGLIGVDIKTSYLGKEYVQDEDILDSDFFVVEKAVITERFSPLNTRKKKDWTTPVNTDALEVEYYVVGRYLANEKKFKPESYVIKKQIKKDWRTEKFSGFELDELQFVACSVFIDHVRSIAEFYKEDKDLDSTGNGPENTNFTKLNNIVEVLNKNDKSPFCQNGFNLVLQKSH